MGRLERMLAILGVSSLWAWVFCLFPSVGASSPPLASHGFGSLVEWSASIAVGTIASFVLVAVYRRWSSRRLDAAVAAMGTLAQLLCLLCFLGGAQWPVLALVGACFSGIAIAFLWVPWGMVLRGLDIAVVEEVFGGALALLGVEYLIVSSLPAEFSAGVLGVLPFVSCACYIVAFRLSSHAEQGGSAARSAKVASMRTFLDQRNGALVSMLLECVVAYGFLTFIWEYLRPAASELPVASPILFSVGFVLAALVLWCYTCFSPQGTVTASVKWVLPLVSFGIVLSVQAVPFAAAVGLLLCATAHAGFEGMLRIRIVALAQKLKARGDLFVVLGMAAVNVGALVGVCIFLGVSLAGVGGVQVALWTMALLLCFSLYLSKSAKGKGADSSAAPPGATICEVMAKRFGLTARETEILGYLLEGRSSPYIRDELVISKSTVDTHVRHIYEKTGVSSKQDLISLSQELAKRCL